MKRIAILMALASCSKGGDTKAAASKLESEFRRKNIAARVEIRDQVLVLTNLKFQGAELCEKDFWPGMAKWSTQPSDEFSAMFPTINFDELAASGLKRVECEDGRGGVFGVDLPYHYTPSRRETMFTGNPTDVARERVKSYAFEAFPAWKSTSHVRPCPDVLEQLNEYLNAGNIKDPWGNEYVMLCGSSLPTGAKDIAIYSRGPDGKDGTADDIKSWE